MSLSRRGCHLALAGGCRDLLRECEDGVRLWWGYWDWPLPHLFTQPPQLDSSGPWAWVGLGLTRQLALEAGCVPTAPSLGRFSVDEGLTWSTHNFTSTSVFVDGLLSEPGDETLVMT